MNKSITFSWFKKSFCPPLNRRNGSQFFLLTTALTALINICFYSKTQLFIPRRSFNPWPCNNLSHLDLLRAECGPNLRPPPPETRWTRWCSNSECNNNSKCLTNNNNRWGHNNHNNNNLDKLGWGRWSGLGPWSDPEASAHNNNSNSNNSNNFSSSSRWKR